MPTEDDIRLRAQLGLMAACVKEADAETRARALLDDMRATFARLRAGGSGRATATGRSGSGLVDVGDRFFRLLADLEASPDAQDPAVRRLLDTIGADMRQMGARFANPKADGYIAFREGKDLSGIVGTFEGHLAAFSRDQGDDVIRPGAFAQTIADAQLKASRARSRILWPVLMSHDQKRIAGGFTSAREDAKGLWVCGELNLDVQEGREAAALIKQGVITGLSIGFSPVKWHREKGVRVLEQVDIGEGSLTPWPMNAEALIASIR